MKFTYRYRTSDNVEHCASIDAADREAAFKLLRAKGIRPGQLQEAPGFFNKLFGKGKRWIAIGVLALAVAATLSLWMRSEREVQMILQGETFSPRHQIYGDPDLLRQIYQDGFAGVFSRPGDRLLAQFAQPGKVIGSRGLVASEFPKYLEEALKSDVEVADADPREVKELKRIVNGMRLELREYMSDGVGSYNSYLRRLVERYEAEKRIYDRVAAELANEKNEEVVKRKNAELRRIGLATIVGGDADREK